MGQDINIDFSQLKPLPDPATTYANAFQVGQTLAKQSAVNNAFKMAGSDPDGAVQGLIGAGDLDNATKLSAINQGNQQAQVNQQVAPMLANGDMQGAAQAYGAAGQPDQVLAIQKLHSEMDVQQLAQASRLHEMVANAATGILHAYPMPQGVDPQSPQGQQVMQQRQAAALHLAQSSGFPPATVQALQNQDFSDQGLQVAVQSNLSAKDQADLALRQATLGETSRHNLATEGKPQYVETKNADGSTSQTLVNPAAVWASGGGPSAVGGAGGGALPIPGGVDTTQGVGKMIMNAATKYGVDPGLAIRIAMAESGLNAGTRPSHKGAIGVMQLMPATAAALGVDPNDTAQNIDGGVRNIAQLSKQFHGDPRLIAAAYNAGPGAVLHHGGVPPYAETHDYVNKVVPGGGQGPVQGAQPYQVASNGPTPGPPSGGAPGGAPGTIRGTPMHLGGSAPVSALPEVSGNGGQPAPITSIPASDRGIVRALIDGRNPFPSGMALRNPAIAKYWQEAAQVDPQFDASNFPTRMATRKDATSGKMAQNITSLNTAVQHAKSLGDLIPQLNNVNGSFATGAINAFKNAAQDPGTGVGARWNTNASALATEISRTFQGGSPHETEIKGWLKQLDENASPAQQKAALSQVAGLLQSRLNAMRAQYQQGMGTTAQPLEAIHPEAAQALATLRTLNNSPAPATAARGAQARAQPQHGSRVAPTGLGHLSNAQLEAMLH